MVICTGSDQYVYEQAAVAMLLQFKTPDNFEIHDKKSVQLLERRNNKRLSKNREQYKCVEDVIAKKYKLTQSTFVLLRKNRKQLQNQSPVPLYDTPIFSEKYNAYNEGLIEYNQHMTSHLKFNIVASHAAERILWAQIRNADKAGHVDLMPVLIRKKQTCGVIFMDCEFMPTMSVTDLRNANTRLVSASREFCSANKKLNRVNMNSVIELSFTVTTVHPECLGHAPPTHMFRYILCLCIRSVTHDDCFRYLQSLYNDDRFFHFCVPKCLTHEQSASINALVLPEYKRGLSNWSGTRCIKFV